DQLPRLRLRNRPSALPAQAFLDDGPGDVRHEFGRFGTGFVIAGDQRAGYAQFSGREHGQADLAIRSTIDTQVNPRMGVPDVPEDRAGNAGFSVSAGLKHDVETVVKLRPHVVAVAHDELDARI